MTTATTFTDDAAEIVRSAKTVVYLRDAQGLLSRHVVAGLNEDQHRAQYSVGPETDTERLAGWPETIVRWHGHVGYGARGVA